MSCHLKWRLVIFAELVRQTGIRISTNIKGRFARKLFDKRIELLGAK